jgi:hypothetical protein
VKILAIHALYSNTMMLTGPSFLFMTTMKLNASKS